MDIKLVNAAVKIKITIDRIWRTKKESGELPRLSTDLNRLINQMDAEEFNEYLRRVKR